MAAMTSPQRHGPSHLRAVREAQGLGLREAARRAGLDPTHLSRVERGQGRLSIESLERLARVLGLTELAKLLQPHVLGLENGDGPAGGRAAREDREDGPDSGAA
jgi:transcriptional regulator with XRE-family HTH domain